MSGRSGADLVFNSKGREEGRGALSSGGKRHGEGTRRGGEKMGMVQLQAV